MKVTQTSTESPQSQRSDGQYPAAQFCTHHVSVATAEMAWHAPGVGRGVGIGAGVGVGVGVGSGIGGVGAGLGGVGAGRGLGAGPTSLGEDVAIHVPKHGYWQ